MEERMFLRICRLLCKFHGLDPYEMTREKFGDDSLLLPHMHTNRICDEAKELLAELREPDEEMADLDRRYASYWDNSVAPPILSAPLGSHIGASWQAMIDAIK